MTPLSARNPRVQQLRKLLRQRSSRDDAGLFVIEGAGLLAEALATGATVHDVFVAADAEIGVELDLDRHGVWELEPSVVASVATTTSPQPVLATVGFLDRGLSDALAGSPTFVVVAAGVREPGNAGTLIRTAAASGADAVVFCDQPVDVYNPKVVRATAGTLFRTQVVRAASVAETFAALRSAGLAVLGLAGTATTDYASLDLTRPTAIVVGNEAHGLGDEARAACDTLVAIPMAGGVESVNVAAAAAAVCFEVSRQRR